MCDEVAGLPADQILVERGALLVAAARAAQIPTLLREIGRLREVTFRAVGEGTGNEVDLDRFDLTYTHLFAWDRAALRLVGAYRLAATDELLCRFGPEGLYTHTLFDYGPEFLERLGPALELGRSFVRREYQRSSGALVALWRGIARLVARLRRYPTLFGAVSIPALYRLESRALINAVLSHLGGYPELRAAVQPRTPFRGPAVPRALRDALATPEALTSAVARLEPDGKGLPVLVREYLKLGGRFLAFNVDCSFSGVLDGLVLVDLRRTDPRLLSFYMGDRAAAEFLGRSGVVRAEEKGGLTG